MSLRFWSEFANTWQKKPSTVLVWSHPTFNRPQAALHWPRDSITFPHVISWKHNTGSSSAEPARSCEAASWLWSAAAHGGSSKRAWRMLPGVTHRCRGQTLLGRQGRGYLHWICRAESTIQAALDDCKFSSFKKKSPIIVRASVIALVRKYRRIF